MVGSPLCPTERNSSIGKENHRLCLGEPPGIPGDPKIPGIHWCITLKWKVLEKSSYVHTKTRCFHRSGWLHAGFDETWQSAELTEQRQARDAHHVNSPDRWQTSATESLQDWEMPPGTLAENLAAVINLTPLKELTYGTDGRLTHFLARGVKLQQGLHIWALWNALVGFLLVPPALLPHIPEGVPAESSSFPISNILRSLYYLIRNSCVTHMVPQWTFEVTILQILQKPSHLKATLMCWSCYPVTNTWISFLFFSCYC